MINDVTGIVFELDVSAGKPTGVVGSDAVSSSSSPITSVKIKSGLLGPSDFSGTPKIAFVVFDVPYTDANYVILLTGEDSRIFTYSAKTQDGFTVSANSNGALTNEVSWFTTPIGET